MGCFFHEAPSKLSRCATAREYIVWAIIDGFSVKDHISSQNQQPIYRYRRDPALVSPRLPPLSLHAMTSRALARKGLFALSLWSYCPEAAAFLAPLPPSSFPTALTAAGQGFGKLSSSDSDRPVPAKTYEKESTPIKDMIDSESAMRDFFSSREEWSEVFSSMAGQRCAASDYLSIDMDFSTAKQSTASWKELTGMPVDEEDRQVIAGFLDSMHQSLLDIPVTESKTDDDNDIHFLEEGRRLLAINRFHVLRDNHGGTVEACDSLFATCWSELALLQSTDVRHTGSLILLPEYELSDLRRFTDMNLLRPLEWLGIQADFEVASMQRQSPAIRLLYKLNDMPDPTQTPDGEEE